VIFSKSLFQTSGTFWQSRSQYYFQSRWTTLWNGIVSWYATDSNWIKMAILLLMAKLWWGILHEAVCGIDNAKNVRHLFFFSFYKQQSWEHTLSVTFQLICFLAECNFSSSAGSSSFSLFLTIVFSTWSWERNFFENIEHVGRRMCDRMYWNVGGDFWSSKNDNVYKEYWSEREITELIILYIDWNTEWMVDYTRREIIKN